MAGKDCLSFYTLPEYETWKEEHSGEKGWHVKYYKGAHLHAACCSH
jgi:DNA topoisomerase-2